MLLLPVTEIKTSHENKRDIKNLIFMTSHNSPRRLQTARSGHDFSISCVLTFARGSGTHSTTMIPSPWFVFLWSGPRRKTSSTRAILQITSTHGSGRISNPCTTVSPATEDPTTTTTIRRNSQESSGLHRVQRRDRCQTRVHSTVSAPSFDSSNRGASRTASQRSCSPTTERWRWVEMRLRP